MISKALTVILLVLVTPAMFARGRGEHIPPAPSGPSEYEVYFRSLTPEEQVMDFVTRFTEPHGQFGPPEYGVASEIVMRETGLEAMPYLRREFARLDFAYCSDNLWNSFCNEAPMNILRLISSMVWLTGFPQNEGVILRPSDEDIAWFAEEAQAKIRRYVATYQLFDGMLSVEKAILDMTDRDAALAFWDDPIRSFYNKYIRGNPELEATIGLPENLVFEGFEGPVLEAQPPVLAAP